MSTSRVVSPVPGVKKPDAQAWIDLQQAFEIEPKPLDFILPGFKAGTVAALVSPGATGKTMLALQAAVYVAGGPDTLGLSVLDKRWERTPGRVVVLSAEDPSEILQTRLHAIGNVLKEWGSSAIEAVYENLAVASLMGYGVDLMSTEWREWIAEATRGARLVILDPLRRFHRLEENDNAQMAGLLSYLEQLCRENSTSVLFLHHVSKASALGGNGDAQQASRGSSVLTDNARLQANLVGMSPDEAKAHQVEDAERRMFVRLTFPKVNYCAPLEDLWFARCAGGVLAQAGLSKAEKQKGKGREQSKH